MRHAIAVVLILAASWGCAELNQLGALVQPPRFEQVPDQPAEVRLAGSSGVAIRLWTRVTNPNPFGLTLGTLTGTLFLEDSRAADADFPLGLPLGAGGDRVIPIDISVRFADLPGLSRVTGRLLARQSVGYRLDGTIGVDAGRLGQPVFGPMTLVRGETRPGSDQTRVRPGSDHHLIVGVRRFGYPVTRIAASSRPADTPSPRYE